MVRTAAAMLWIALATAGVAQTTYQPLQTRATGVEVIARLSVEPRHVTVLGDGRIIFTVTPETRKQLSVAELVPSGAIKPFPNMEWASRPEGEKGTVDVAAIASDMASGYVVIIDIGNSKTNGKLIVWDSKQNKLAQLVPFERRRASDFRFVQDVAVDMKRKSLYLISRDAKKQSAAIITVDLPTKDIRVHTLARLNDKGGITTDITDTSSTAWSMKEGMNLPMTIDPANEWVYFTGPGAPTLFRVRAADLANPEITSDELMAKVERYGDKVLATSIAADNAGHVYVCEGSNGKIGVLSADRGYRTWIHDEGLLWPDDICLGPDGYAYITVNHLRRLAVMQSPAKRLEEMPYTIARVKLPQ
jgi:hypothetical protein